MKDLTYFCNLIEFIGDEITEDQADRLMIEIKRELSIVDIQILMRSAPSLLYVRIADYVLDRFEHAISINKIHLICTFPLQSDNSNVYFFT